MKRCSTCQADFPTDAAFCPHDGQILVAVQDPSDPDPRLGTTLGGRYLLVRRIADGAQGRVYEARDTSDRSRLAVKVLHSDVARDVTSRERLKREAQTTQSLDSEHILKMIGVFEDPGDVHFLVMELLEGEELSTVLAREKRLAAPRVMRILSQVALALDHAHDRGVIHRDLKPENIFLCRGDKGDHAKVLDFGSVKLQVETGPKLTALGTTLGSPYYMAPEQALALPNLDRRADVFSVGAILYEALTGKIAFAAPNVAAILFKLLNDEPLPVSVQAEGLPSELDEVIEEALAKQPGLRFPSVGALADAFGRALGLSGTPAEWSQMSVEELESTIGTHRPPPAPFRGEDTAPVRTAASVEPLPAVHRPDFDDVRLSYDVPRSNTTMVAILALAGVAVLGILGIVLWILS